MDGGPAYKHYRIRPKDKVLRAFFLNDARLSCIMGPVGSAKTTASLQRFIRFARLQEPHPVDQVRRTRWVYIRDTYRNLERTTLKTWNEWWPRNFPGSEWKGGGNGEPAIHNIRIGLPDGTTIETEIIFAAVGEHAIEEFTGGFEITGFGVGEATDLPEEVYLKLLERVGRYPRVDDDHKFAGASWVGGWLDCNAPNYGNHIERNFVTSPIPGSAFFRQPGGLDPDAENLANLPGGRKYYENIVLQSPPHYVRRMVDNMFGHDRSGKPVYKEYNPFKHLSKTPLRPMQGRKLVCGLDQGQSPAAVFEQRTVAGQIRILKELALVNTGPRQFGRMLREFREEHFPGFDVTFVCDPAAFNATDTSEDASDVWVRIVENELEATIKPAPSFRRDAREKPFRDHMSRAIDGETEAFIVGSDCRMVHEGLNQHFRFRKVSASGQPDRYSDQIEKNDHSHPCEAAEYAAMELVGMGEILGNRRRAPADDASAEHWRPLGM